jgi:citrate synthase
MAPKARDVCWRAIEALAGKGGARKRGCSLTASRPALTPCQVAYLVLYGDLPSRPQLALFQDAVMRHSALPT